MTKKIMDFVPSVKETVKIVIVTTILAMTGIGAMIIAKLGGRRGA